jgi:hypothetical protein
MGIDVDTDVTVIARLDQAIRYSRSLVTGLTSQAGQ